MLVERSQDCLVGKLTRLRAGRLRFESRWGKIPPPSLLFNGYRSSLRRVEGPVRECNHLPPSGAEIKNEWSYTPTPLIACFVKMS
jgi:hypothetical protein